jgi:three-Cys-motif partner protein
MPEKPYEWTDGATLQEHSKRKLKILREYFSRYLTVRCQLPQQERFRLAVVDGFAGGGRYKCGTPGSPLIFVDELKTFVVAENIRRADQGMKPLHVDCQLIFNDAKAAVVEMLKDNLAPLIGDVKETAPQLQIDVAYLSEPFETAFPKIKGLLDRGHFRNVVFNLDQCGHSHVERITLIDILQSYRGAEIFYTFSIEALVTYLRKSEPEALTAQLAHIGLDDENLRSMEGAMSNQTWLGAAERVVFGAFKDCAPYVSPFSIHNPEGWRYWLIHFANSYRGRQEYNNVLHRNATLQAHFGRSGLEMLAYDPRHEVGSLYLFDDLARASAKDQLMDDVPRLVSEYGDALSVGNFYEAIYNNTPAHMDDIHAAIIENADLEVITEGGGERRKPGTIVVGDTIRLRKQRSFFPVFSRSSKKRK